MPNPTATGLSVTCNEQNNKFSAWQQCWLMKKGQTFVFPLAKYTYTCLTSWMRDSTRVFTFARGPVTPLTLTCDEWRIGKCYQQIKAQELNFQINQLRFYMGIAGTYKINKTFWSSCDFLHPLFRCSWCCEQHLHAAIVQVSQGCFLGLGLSIAIARR